MMVFGTRQTEPVRSMMEKAHFLFSVIVPTFNRGPLCVAAIKSVLAQRTEVPYEVIVVDNNSTDDTRRRVDAVAAEAGDRVCCITEPAQGVSAARNAGIAAARGEILAFLDDDTVAEPGWLGALAETYRVRDDACCVGGKILIELPQRLPAWFDPRSQDLMSQLGHLDLGDGTIRRKYPEGLWAGNFSIRREVLRRVGLFDPRLGLRGRHGLLGEELDLCWRVQAMGGSVFYCGGAMVRHQISPRRISKSFFRRRLYWEGRTWARLRRHELVRVTPWAVVRSGLRVVRNALDCTLAPHARDPRRRFADELDLWRCLGYACQSFHQAPFGIDGLSRRPARN